MKRENRVAFAWRTVKNTRPRVITEGVVIREIIEEMRSALGKLRYFNGPPGTSTRGLDCLVLLRMLVGLERLEAFR